jgi:outer membrane protein
MKISSLILASVILFCQQVSYAADLNDALISAYQKNPEIKSAILELKAVDENMPAAISGMLPSVSISAEEAKRNTTLNNIDKIKGGTDSQSIEITEPLFKGGRTVANIKKAKNQIFAARAKLQNTEQQVLLSVVEAYMNIVRDKELYELAQNNTKVMQKHLEAAKERFKLGEVTQTDVAQAKASLAKANSELIKASRSVESSKSDYRKIVGEEPINIQMPPMPAVIKGSRDDLVNTALANNPIVKSAEYNFKAAKNDISVQESSLLPQVDAFANKQRQDGLTAIDTKLDNNTVGVRIAIPLYQGGSEYAQVRKAKELANKNSYDVAAARNNVRDAVINAYEDIQVAESLIESNQASVESYQTALSGTEQEAFAGVRSTIDILDAEHALFDAKSGLIASRRDRVVSAYSLLAQIGKLTAKDLSLKTEIYNPDDNYNKVKYKMVGF